MAVSTHWWLRMAQALGLPVVPEVKIRQERSAGEDLVGGEGMLGAGREAGVRMVMVESAGGGGTDEKE